MTPNRAKQRLKEGKPVLMGFLAVNDTASAEVVARCGIDILILDNEHMAFSDADILNMTRTIHACGASCLLRTAVKDVKTLTRYMEFGIDGFCATQTTTVEDARAIIAATKYPPMGERGLCATGKGMQFGFLDGKSVAEHMEFANDNTIVFVTLENKEALENAKEIASLPGIDSVHIGPNDLSAALGYGGNTAHPEVGRLMAETQKIIFEAGNTIGHFVSSADQIPKLVEEGAKILIVGTDINHLKAAFLPFGKAAAAIQ